MRGNPGSVRCVDIYWKKHSYRLLNLFSFFWWTFLKRSWVISNYWNINTSCKKTIGIPDFQRWPRYAGLQLPGILSALWPYPPTPGCLVKRWSINPSWINWIFSSRDLKLGAVKPRGWKSPVLDHANNSPLEKRATRCHAVIASAPLVAVLPSALWDTTGPFP